LSGYIFTIERDFRQSLADSAEFVVDALALCLNGTFGVDTFSNIRRTKGGFCADGLVHFVTSTKVIY
jgi:hypothetical protein